MEAFPLYLVANALQWVIAAIFMQAGVSKLRVENQAYYVNVIGGYAMTPKQLTPIMPRVVGCLELLCCMLILVPVTSRLGLVLAVCLFALYLSAFIKQIIQGKADMNCGCAGPGAEVKISPMLVARNALLILICLFALKSVGMPYGYQWFLVLPTAAVFCLIYTSSDQLIANQQKIQLMENT